MEGRISESLRKRICAKAVYEIKGFRKAKWIFEILRNRSYADGLSEIKDFRMEDRISESLRKCICVEALCEIQVFSKSEMDFRSPSESFGIAPK